MDKKETSELAVIGERVIAMHEDIIELTGEFRRMNGTLKSTCEDVVVLKSKQKRTDQIQSVVTTGFIGGIISKIMGLW